MLEPKQRGRIWYAVGRIDYNGRPISDYYRRSTGASSERGCRDWIEAETARVIRAHVSGEEHPPMSFADAVLLYEAPPADAKYLLAVTPLLGETLVRDITGEKVRALGPRLYPDASTDTWLRQVITPVRAVINHAHDMLGGDRCPAIRIKGYPRAERVAQDKKRGRKSRVERQPGSWEWLLRFREHASQRQGAMALTMFLTGARIGQVVQMHPDKHLDLQNHRICIPGAKGHDDRWVTIPVELVVELANLRPRIPRGWESGRKNLRVFGYAHRFGPLKAWHRACTEAGIEHIMPHAAGRHGFGQEMKVRQGVDSKAVAAAGGWSDTKMVDERYTHAEDVTGKINGAIRTGLAQAENATGLKLLKTGS